MIRNAGRLLVKDLRLLVRGRALLALLVGYPLLVAVLVAVALQSGEQRPSVAFVNLDTSGRTVQVGSRRLGVEDYARRLGQEVHLDRLSPGEASRALDQGRVSAVLTIPSGFISDLQAGVHPPVITVETSRRSPIQADAIQRRLESAIFRVNQQLASTYVDQTLHLVQVLVDGGDVSAFTRSGHVLGLTESRRLVRDVQASLRRSGRADVAARLDPLLNFIVQAGVNLDLANAAAQSLTNPIRLRIPPPPQGREPLTGFGFAGALLVSLGLIGTLLGAAALSSEREDGTLTRLRRGLIRTEGLVGEKVSFAALVGLVVGLLLLAAVAIFTALTVDRWGLWIASLLAAGLAFGAFGVLIGALARETRTALLATIMLALPLIFLGLFTDSAIASGISQVFPFGPAFRSFQTLLVEPSVPGRLGLRIGQLLLLGLAFGGIASFALRRRADA
ncbi:MAG TPA: ABC transporter permease [Miltoncostaeaceae bacterium]|nr:ABC transporter permease [Miltoncostaeaceae bacterium]